MARICDLVTLLKVDKKVYKNPEWWNTQHKIQKEVKLNNLLKPNANFKTSYYVTGSTKFDSFAKDQQKLPEYAPWDPIFRRAKTLILFNNKK
jgi:hypothetical protein